MTVSHTILRLRKTQPSFKNSQFLALSHWQDEFTSIYANTQEASALTAVLLFPDPTSHLTSGIMPVPLLDEGNIGSQKETITIKSLSKLP